MIDVGFVHVFKFSLRNEYVVQKIILANCSRLIKAVTSKVIIVDWKQWKRINKDVLTWRTLLKNCNCPCFKVRQLVVDMKRLRPFLSVGVHLYLYFKKILELSLERNTY